MYKTLMARCRYVIFENNTLEVHVFGDVRNYEMDDIEEVKVNTIKNVKAHRQVYILYFKDGYQCQVNKDKKLEDVFTGRFNQ